MSLEDYEQQLSQIIGSKSFGNSTTYANLLRYLIRCSIQNDVPKETTIANEIFAKKDFDPSQSTLVRVYVYNLRKKLDTFYKNEGVALKKRIRIPKGSYAVEIIEPEKKMVGGHTRKVSPWVMALLGLLLISLAYSAYLNATKSKTALVDENGLWKDLVQGEFPKMLVLGDLFVYNEVDTVNGQARTIRVPQINSLPEFEAFKTENAQGPVSMEPLTYTHLILGSTQWIKKLSEIFYSVQRDYTIRTMSRFNPKQLQDYDILVVGMQKTLGVFRTFSKESAFGYDAENDAFIYKGTKDHPPISYRPKGDANSYHTDYSLMAKLPGPNNNSVYLFSGIWDTGATQSLKNFTDAKLLSELEAQLRTKFGDLPEFYEIFFEVNGVDRMELSSKVLYMHELE